MEPHPLDIIAAFPWLESIAVTLNIQHSSTNSLFPEEPYSQLWRNLKQLHITGTGALFEGIYSSIANLQESIKSCTLLNLERLTVEMLPSWSDSTLLHMICNSPRLSHLYLAYCAFSGRTLLTAAKSFALQNIVELKIIHCPNITAEDCNVLLESCPRIQCLRLGDLIFDMTTFPVTATTTTTTKTTTTTTTEVLTTTTTTTTTTTEMTLDRRGIGSITRICPTLVSLHLEDCIMPATGLRQLLDICSQLRHLSIDPVPPGAEELVTGSVWGCLQLRELSLGAFSWTLEEKKNEKKKAEVRKGVWDQVSRLRKLVSLKMTDAGGPHSPGSHNSANGLATSLVIAGGGGGGGTAGAGHATEEGLYKLQKLPGLQRLTLNRRGSWTYADIFFIGETFSMLEVFGYSQQEMSTPLWSWMRQHRPDVQMRPIQQSIFS
ncbi:hypothetical protein BGW38_000844 [Lunasporangiospora selenospora]|uniref:Uncharacterized protein n=1 Tax=Lunasporangiospora selenospora TaxID=979761 RepID=A0A9P6FVH7_9FUNG|nr:hypothetical protein BGW38_000844 [Lunasporangiospora selenospora]